MIPPTTASERASRACELRLLAVHAGFLALCFAVTRFMKTAGMSFPCVFHSLFGFFCPGCGMTRAMWALSSFDIAESFLYNPIPVLLTATLLAAMSVEAYGAVRAKKVHFRYTAVCLAVTFGTALAVCVFKNLSLMT